LERSDAVKNKKNKMLNLDPHQNKIKYLLLSLGVIIIIMVAVITWRLNRETVPKIPDQKPTVETSKELTPEDIMQSVSAPEGVKVEPVSEETIQSLSVSEKKDETVKSTTQPIKPVDQKVLDSLSAPTK